MIATPMALRYDCVTLSLKRPYVRVMVPMQCTNRSGASISVLSEMTSRTEKEASLSPHRKFLRYAAIILVLVFCWDLFALEGSY